jgi:hemoglobin/transferrin/lactoferrin receptor protein
MRLIFYSLLLCSLFSSLLFSQNSIIFGTVRDSETGLFLPLVNVKIIPLNINTITDEEGNFKFENVQKGRCKIIFTHVGYKSFEIIVAANPDSVRPIEINLIPSPINLGEVIVYSTKTISLLNDIPVPAEVVTYNKIKRSNPVSVPDVLKNEPGLALGRDGIWGTQISIRGLSKSSIVTMVDGNRLETATDVAAELSLIDVNDIDRIEIIKGGSSSLYGTGALGGIINIITKSGSFNDNFIIKGNAGSSYSTVNSEGMGNLSLEADAPDWYTRLSTTLRKADNTRTPRGFLSNSQYSDNNISFSAGVRPFKNHEIFLKYQNYFAKNVGIPGGNLLFPANALVTYPVEQRQMFSAEYSIKNITRALTSLSAKYFYQDIYRDVKNIPYMTKYITTPSGQPDKKMIVQEITPHAQHYTNGVQIESNWILNDNNYLVLGFDGWQRNLDSRRERHILIQNIDKNTQDIISTVNQVIGERPIPESKFQSLGLYAQDEWNLVANKLKLILGGRLDKITITNKQLFNPVYIIVNGVTNNNPPNSLQWNAANINNYSWSTNVGLSYALEKGMHLNLSLAHSFRSPSLEERYQFIDLGNVVELGNPNLNPEKGYFVDGGIKLWNDNLSGTFDMFYNYIAGLVVQKNGTYDGRAALINSNVGKAILYGFDGSLEYNIFGNFVFYTRVSFVRGRNVEENLDLPQIPPLNGSLGIKTSLTEYLNIDFSASAFASQNKVAPGEIFTPGYVYFDLYLSSKEFNIKGITYQLFGGVENLTNKAYRNHLATNRGSVTVEPGRNIFIKASIGF